MKRENEPHRLVAVQERCMRQLTSSDMGGHCGRCQTAALAVALPGKADKHVHIAVPW